MIPKYLEDMITSIYHKSSFRSGIEVGMVWNSMEEGTNVIKGVYDKINFDIFIRMSERMKYFIEKSELARGEGILVTFTRKDKSS